MKKGTELRIDPEFRRLVAPIQEADRLKQEKWTTRRRHSLPIRVWENTILVDYEAYFYSQAKGLSIRTSQVFLKSYDDAVNWICRNQLKRTDIAEEMRKYLIGKLYLTERALGAKERAAARSAIRAGEEAPEYIYTTAMQEATATNKASRIGAEYHIASETVKKYGRYTSCLDQLFAQAPAFIQKILQGKIYLSHESLMTIQAMNRAELISVTRYFLDETERNPTFNKYRVKQEKERKEKARKKPVLPGSVKEMPDYDPDAVVTSLALTIPSWVGSIQRAEKNTDFAQISERARNSLMHELYALVYAIESILSQLEEDLHG